MLGHWQCPPEWGRAFNDVEGPPTLSVMREEGKVFQIPTRAYWQWRVLQEHAVGDSWWQAIPRGP